MFPRPRFVDGTVEFGLQILSIDVVPDRPKRGNNDVCMTVWKGNRCIMQGECGRG